MANARHDDPWTSHAAWEDVSHKTTKGRWLVLAALNTMPMNDFELAAFTGWQQTSIGKRRLECQRRGLVQACLNGRGEQIARKAPSGSMSLVWEISEAGKGVVTAINDPKFVVQS